MKRKKFLKRTALAAAGIFLMRDQIIRAAGINGELYPELKKHKISKAELVEIKFHWPRLVGKNARLDVHGQYHTTTVLKLNTNLGSTGFGLCRSRVKDQLSTLIGKSVSELISPDTGILPGVRIEFDLALHDLIGVILNKPVYEIMGSKGTKETPIYSGMIYFDEMEPKENPAGIQQVLDNCSWDVEYGYRQLKVKIGRSGKWYSHDKGLQMDIDVVKKIHEQHPNVELLVDSNNAYSLQDTIDFLKGIGDVPLYWVEEPFHEEYEHGKKLRDWMDENGFAKTFYADGEAKPNHDLCLKMGADNILDVYLPDIQQFGFTFWRNLIPELKKQKTFGSPHAWGNMLKTHYNAHIAAGSGNVYTLEGVTCISDDIDFGNYQIENGKLKVSNAPGFGMTLLK
jgi:D-galactarolactone cycloisomerase